MAEHSGGGAHVLWGGGWVGFESRLYFLKTCAVLVDTVPLTPSPSTTSHSLGLWFCCHLLFWKSPHACVPYCPCGHQDAATQ